MLHQNKMKKIKLIKNYIIHHNYKICKICLFLWIISFIVSLGPVISKSKKYAWTISKLDKLATK